MENQAVACCPNRIAGVELCPLVAALLAALGWGLAVLAQPPSSGPAPDQAEEARLTTLVSLITDLRTTPETRSFLLRDLLANGSQAATRAAGEILTTSQEEAVLTAVCAALSELDYPDNALLEPLLALVRQHDGPVRSAAIQALSAYDGPESAAAVGRFVLDPVHPFSARLTAMRVLAEIPQPPESIDALIEALDDPRAEIRSAAHTYLLQTGLEDLGPDFAAWCDWWAEHRHESPVDRLRTVLADKKRRLRATEQALSAAAARNLVLLREIYDRSSEAEKTERLASLLRDSEPGVRALGLELVNAMIADRKDVPPEVLEPLRELVSDPVAKVRQRAIPLLGDLRVPSDVALLLSALKADTDQTALCELINALGRFGDPSAIEHLVPYLSPDSAPAVIGEAADSLGLLLGSVRAAAPLPSEAPPGTARAVRALLDQFENTPADQIELRERVLRAMAKIADPSFGPSFLAHIDDAQSGMKSSAIQGLAALGDGAHAPLLVRHLADANAQVRQAAAQALGRLGEKEDHLEALLGRLDPEAEPVETIRDAAWEAFVRLFRKQEPAAQLRWADRLAPGTQNPAAGNERFVHLLLEIEKTLSGVQNETDLLAEVRLRLADAYAEMGRHADAVGYHQQTFEWLKSQPSVRARQIGTKIFNSQLATGRFNLAVDHLAFLLAEATEPDEAPLRQVVDDFLQSRLDASELEEALNLVDKLLDSQSVPLSEDWRGALRTLRQDTLDQRELRDRQQVAAWATQLRGSEEEAAAARQQILGLGPRAVGGLAEALGELLDAPEHDLALEGELVELIRQIRPDWPGFQPDTPLEQKRSVLAELTTEE